MAGMSKPLGLRAPTVMILSHAWERLQERWTGPGAAPRRTQVKARIRRKLQAQLMSTKTVYSENGYLKTEIMVYGLRAVLALGATGAWIVTTFLKEWGD